MAGFGLSATHERSRETGHKPYTKAAIRDTPRAFLVDAQGIEPWTSSV